MIPVLLLLTTVSIISGSINPIDGKPLRHFGFTVGDAVIYDLRHRNHSNVPIDTSAYQPLPYVPKRNYDGSKKVTVEGYVYPNDPSNERFSVNDPIYEYGTKSTTSGYDDENADLQKPSMNLDKKRVGLGESGLRKSQELDEKLIALGLNYVEVMDLLETLNQKH